MGDLAVQPAESAPATPTPNFDTSTWSADEHSHWMNTGDVPEAKPAESTPAKESAEPEKAEPAPESAPVVTQQEHKGKGAESRKAELAAEIQDLLKQRAELRKEIEAKPAESPSAKKEPKLEKPAKPVFGEKGHEDETWEQFEARQESHVEALTEYKVKLALQEDRAAREKERKEAETAAQNKSIEDGWKQRVEKATAKHADFAEVAFSKDVPISPTMDGFILDSDLGPEILYYFGTHAEEAKQIAAMPPFKAARELFKIESSLSTPAEEKPAKAPAIPITRAAKPATDLRATNAAPVDELKAAIEAGDFSRYQALADQRDIDRHKRR